MAEEERPRSCRHLALECSVLLALLGPASVEGSILTEDVRPEFSPGQVRYEVATVYMLVIRQWSHREATLVCSVALPDVRGR